MPRSKHQLRQQESIPSEIDGEEVTIYNWVNVLQPGTVWGHGTAERFDANIGAGDSKRTPEYVTEWVAGQLDAEFGIRLSSRGDITVVDPTDDDVTLL